MPRNVRNFWIELEVDGQKKTIATGPVSKDGGFRLNIKMRDRGMVGPGIEVLGYAGRDRESGLLFLQVFKRRGDPKSFTILGLR